MISQFFVLEFTLGWYIPTLLTCHLLRVHYFLYDSPKPQHLVVVACHLSFFCGGQSESISFSLVNEVVLVGLLTSLTVNQ